MSAHGNRPEAPGLPLPALVAQLRGRCEAIARLQGGAPHYLEELAVFREAAASSGWLLDPPPPELGRAPDDEGNLAFFDPERNLVVSDTHPGNLILMDDGTLAPIDFRVQRLTGPLIDIVQRLT